MRHDTFSIGVLRGEWPYLLVVDAGLTSLAFGGRRAGGWGGGACHSVGGLYGVAYRAREGARDAQQCVIVAFLYSRRKPSLVVIVSGNSVVLLPHLVWRSALLKNFRRSRLRSAR